MELATRDDAKGSVREGRACPSNDNRRRLPARERTHGPPDAVARIFRPSRAATTSGEGRSRDWRLVFERRSAPFIEPLMGYTGSDDPLITVELRFPTLESAIRHAEREGLSYVVREPAPGRRGGARPPPGAERPAPEARASPAVTSASERTMRAAA